MSGHDDLISAYAKNPPNRGPLEDPTVQHFEESRVCADTLRVYLRLAPDGEIRDWSFEGKTSLVTTACAAMFGESVVGMSAAEAASLTYAYFPTVLGLDLTPKRHHAASLPILATRNALHQWMGDGKKDDFSDVMP